MMIRFVSLLMALMIWAGTIPATAGEPLRIVIDEGVIEPLPYAVPDFVADSTAGALFLIHI